MTVDDALTAIAKAGVGDDILGPAQVIARAYIAERQADGQARELLHKLDDAMKRSYLMEQGDTESGPTRMDILTAALQAAEKRGAERAEAALDEADDPNRPPYGICQHKGGCEKWASVGTPTPDGYKWLCHWHWKELDDSIRAAMTSAGE